MNTECYFKKLDSESLKIIKTRLLLLNSQCVCVVSLKPSIQTIRPSMPYATAQDGSVQIYSYLQFGTLCGSAGKQTVSHPAHYKQYSLLTTCNMKIGCFIVTVKDHALSDYFIAVTDIQNFYLFHNLFS
jgi:hypothetical protein